ncbi:MAG: diguanylate cyclase [Eubacterium sp.]|nr:diguanylate cyclase [Eubacterium sp.]
MKQFQFNYDNNDNLLKSLRKIKQWCSSSVTSAVFFRIYTEDLDRGVISDICSTISKEIPDACYMGSSTNGNIMMGDFAGSPITIICTVYEYPSTKIKILQYPLSDMQTINVINSLMEELDNLPWVKAIMLNTTIRGMSMTSLCEHLSLIKKDIQIFGGGAFSADMNENAAFVFSSVGEVSDHAIVFALIGGEDYYIKTSFITGWKPLGKELLVTKAKGPILYELDGKPAYETYYKYLNIKNDENFFVNTLEFPFIYNHKGIDILRAPIASNDDGSLTMTADIEQNAKARISYGDPWTILESVNEESFEFQKFIPESITIFSCAARRTFWGLDEIGNESLPFQSLAPTSGFYTSGEFLRTDGEVNQHNVTLVIGAEREGEPSESNIAELNLKKGKFSGKVSMINRLATFIQAATQELEEANDELERMAISDGLTKLYNRGEIQRRIQEKAHEAETVSFYTRKKSGTSLIMIDIDDFKKVNDTYGHKEGDIVLQGLSQMLMDEIDKNAPGASAGRWGGEEFMILLPGSDEKAATEIAELFRSRFAEIEFPNAKHRTISVGVTELIDGEDVDVGCMRVDDALYEAKRTGKNKVVVM